MAHWFNKTYVYCQVIAKTVLRLGGTWSGKGHRAAPKFRKTGNTVIPPRPISPPPQAPGDLTGDTLTPLAAIILVQAHLPFANVKGKIPFFAIFFWTCSPKEKEIKAKINKQNLVKLKSFCTAKEIKETKRQPTEQEKIVANDMTDKGLVNIKNI